MQRAKITFDGVPGEIEKHVHYPTASEDLAIVQGSSS